MEKNAYKDKTYMEILMTLRKIIATDYKKGGRFPSSREMCKKLNVSLPTYGKAIERLLTDGSAYKNSNKGIFIFPDENRIHKIGIVLDNGAESPFLVNMGNLGLLFQKLSEHHFTGQILQAPSREKILQKAIFYGIDFILWQTTITPQADWIADTGDSICPILFLNFNEPPDPMEFQDRHIACISRDCTYEGIRRAEILIKHKAKRFLYIGKYESGSKYGLFSSLRENGVYVSDLFPMETIHQISKNLENAIFQDRIDTVYAEGAASRMEIILRILSKIPTEKRPRLFCSEFTGLRELLRKYSTVPFSGACTGEIRKLTDPAIHEILKYLRENGEIKSREIPCFHFYPPKEIFSHCSK